MQQKLAEAGMNRNAFIVKLIREIPVQPRDQLMELNLQFQIMNRLMRGIATNINQIAKIANTYKAVPSAKLMVDAHKEVQILRNNLQPLWEETRKALWPS